ncbi:hypothetical protein F2Q68_00012056 [Brassica cretica]|uniref:Uncharacterized protein n=1 Tax=Brassica cretica TaxID=69181 RepID=A0A8S9KX56_BRACR|nr:hypothetical protein F2Q68_00012056 [Brassica cretica]
MCEFFRFRRELCGGRGMLGRGTSPMKIVGPWSFACSCLRLSFSGLKLTRRKPSSSSSDWTLEWWWWSVVSRSVLPGLIWSPSSNSAFSS